MTRRWSRILTLLERALDLARREEAPMGVRDLAEEIATECVAITQETSRGRAEYAAKRRSEGASFRGIGEELGVGRERVRQILDRHERRVARDRELADTPISLASSIDRLDVPAFALVALRKRGIVTVGDLVALDRTTLLGKDKIGPMTLRRINAELARHRLVG